MKKILVPNSVPTQPKLENSKRKQQKNSKKLKKVNSGIISMQKGLREAEKEKKKISEIAEPKYSAFFTPFMMHSISHLRQPLFNLRIVL